jgi:hypothetical protein
MLPSTCIQYYCTEIRPNLTIAMPEPFVVVGLAYMYISAAAALITVAWADKEELFTFGWGFCGQLGHEHGMSVWRGWLQGDRLVAGVMAGV